MKLDTSEHPFLRIRTMLNFRTALPTLIIGMLLPLVPATALAQVAAPGLAERMSQRDFEASGLTKLSPSELQHLNQWLAVRPIVVKDGKVSTEPVFYTEESKRTTIQTRIAGSFRGWSGKTSFSMDNDEVWQQAESGSFGNIEIDNPAVRIKPMMMGSWLMYVDGCGCSVRVKRIK